MKEVKTVRIALGYDDLQILINNAEKLRREYANEGRFGNPTLCQKMSDYFDRKAIRFRKIQDKINIPF